MTDNSRAGAFASQSSSSNGTRHKQDGLSKREYFAGLAMQSMLSDVEVGRWIQTDPRYDGSNFKNVVSINAVEFADALLAALSKPKEI